MAFHDCLARKASAAPNHSYRRAAAAANKEQYFAGSSFLSILLRNAHADQVDAINRLTARRRIYPRVLALIGTQVERVQMQRAIGATT